MGYDSILGLIILIRNYVIIKSKYLFWVSLIKLQLLKNDKVTGNLDKSN